MTTFLNAYSTIATPIDGAPQTPSSTRSVVDDSTGQPHLATSAEATAELDHLAQFNNYVWNQAAGQPSVSSNVLALSNHVLRTRWHYVFEVADNFSPANLAAFSEWAERANAVFVMPDLSVCNAAGQPLPDAAKAPRPARAVRRMARIRRDLWNQGIRIPENLPAAASEDEIIIRRPQYVLPRAQALTSLAQTTINVAHGQPVAPVAADYSPAEQRFIDSVNASAVRYSPQLQHSARTGGVFAMGAAETLAWALGLVEQNEVAFPQLNTLHAELAKPADALRPLAEVAENLELSTCLRWWDVEQPQDPDRSGLILGRIYALLWLTDPTSNWDEIQVNI